MVSYKRIGLDTNVLIYYIEEHPIFLKKIEPLIEKCDGNQDFDIRGYVICIASLLGSELCPDMFS